VRGAGKLLELSEVPLLTAATAATLETPWTIGVGIAPKNLFKTNSPVDISHVVMPVADVAALTVGVNTASLASMIWLNVAVILPRIAEVLKACVLGPLP